MDQVQGERLRVHQRLEQFVTALGSGIILVDAGGQIVWVDERTRRRVNGGLHNLDLPILPATAEGIECFVSIVDAMVNDEPIQLCVIQETSDPKQTGTDLTHAIESIMTDTSWLTRALIDKLKIWRQAAHPTAKPSDLDLLTEREREILGLICEGRGDGEMSEILNLSRNTVRNHVASLYRKIGVNRRSAAIIWARERGITSQDVIARNQGSRVQRTAHPP
jgi:DNA-binding CsgD family transcriptional regulator